jgi:glycosyltransferase involved in cell wall biosynthesis
MRKKLISYIFPIFNEEGNLELLYKTVSKLLETNKHYDYELLFVNDGSKDKSWDIIKKLNQKRRIKKLMFKSMSDYEIVLKYKKGDERTRQKILIYFWNRYQPLIKKIARKRLKM